MLNGSIKPCIIGVMKSVHYYYNYRIDPLIKLRLDMLVLTRFATSECSYLIDYFVFAK